MSEGCVPRACLPCALDKLHLFFEAPGRLPFLVEFSSSAVFFHGVSCSCQTAVHMSQLAPQSGPCHILFQVTLSANTCRILASACLVLLNIPELVSFDLFREEQIPIWSGTR
jgi:hypothetical protein